MATKAPSAKADRDFMADLAAQLMTGKKSATATTPRSIPPVTFGGPSNMAATTSPVLSRASPSDSSQSQADKISPDEQSKVIDADRGPSLFGSHKQLADARAMLRSNTGSAGKPARSSRQRMTASPRKTTDLPRTTVVAGRADSPSPVLTRTSTVSRANPAVLPIPNLSKTALEANQIARDRLQSPAPPSFASLFTESSPNLPSTLKAPSSTAGATNKAEDNFQMKPSEELKQGNLQILSSNNVVSSRAGTDHSKLLVSIKEPARSSTESAMNEAGVATKAKSTADLTNGRMTMSAQQNPDAATHRSPSDAKQDTNAQELAAVQKKYDALVVKMASMEQDNFEMFKKLEYLLQYEEKRRYMGTSKAPFGITVVFARGTSVQVQASASTTIRDTIRRARAVKGLRPDQCTNPSMVFNGAEIGHSRELGEIGVGEGSVLRMDYDEAIAT